MIVSKGQSLVDACMQAYGSINQLYKLAKDNDIKLDATPTPGTELSVSDGIGNSFIINYYIRKRIIPSSGK
jgi:hypothetical protein